MMARLRTSLGLFIGIGGWTRLGGSDGPAPIGNLLLTQDSDPLITQDNDYLVLE